MVNALAARPEDHADTARWEQLVFAEGPGQRRFFARSAGTADFGHRRWRGRQELASGETHEFFLADRFDYRRRTGQTGWEKSPRKAGDLFDPVPDPLIAGERDSGAPSFLPSVERRRRIVDALVVSFEGAEAVTLRGTPTRRYRVRVERDRPEGRLDEALSAEASAWGELSFEVLEVDAWVDGRGRLRRMSTFLPFAGDDGFRIEEWWGFGDARSVPVPDDLGDPTIHGGEGTTSFLLAGPPLGRVELVDGPGGVAMNLSRHEDDLTFSIHERVPGARPHTWSLSTGVPRRSGDVLPVRLVRTTYYQEGRSTRSVFEPVAPCERPTGTLVVRELVVDAEDVIVRLRATFSLSCDRHPPVQGEMRFHALT